MMRRPMVRRLKEWCGSRALMIGVALVWQLALRETWEFHPMMWLRMMCEETRPGNLDAWNHVLSWKECVVVRRFIFKNPFVDGDDVVDGGEDNSEPNTARGQRLFFFVKRWDSCQHCHWRHSLISRQFVVDHHSILMQQSSGVLMCRVLCMGLIALLTCVPLVIRTWCFVPVQIEWTSLTPEPPTALSSKHVIHTCWWNLVHWTWHHEFPRWAFWYPITPMSHPQCYFPNMIKCIINVSITTHAGGFWHTGHDIMFSPRSVSSIFIYPWITHSIISKTCSLVSTMFVLPDILVDFSFIRCRPSIHIQFKSMHKETSTVWTDSGQPPWCSSNSTRCRPRYASTQS